MKIKKVCYTKNINIFDIKNINNNIPISLTEETKEKQKQQQQQKDNNESAWLSSKRSASQELLLPSLVNKLIGNEELISGTTLLTM